MLEEKKEQERTRIAKNTMAKNMELTLGIVTTAAKKTGISAESHRLWMRDDSEYRNKIKAIKMMKQDFVESKLMEKVEEGDISAVIFASKTVNRDRGYADKVELSGTVNVNQFSNLSDEELDAKIAKLKLLSDQEA